MHMFEFRNSESKFGVAGTQFWRQNSNIENYKTEKEIKNPKTLRHKWRGFFVRYSAIYLNFPLRLGLYGK